MFTVHGERTKLIEEILKISNFIKPGTANSTGMTYAMINLQQLRTVLQELVIVRGFKAEVLVGIFVHTIFVSILNNFVSSLFKDSKHLLQSKSQLARVVFVAYVGLAVFA